MTDKIDVVITGIGVVSPIGVGAEAYWRSMQRLESGVGLLEEQSATDLPVPIGGRVRQFDAKGYVRPRKSIKIMSHEIQMAVASAGMACESAGLKPEDETPERMGVTAGCDFLYGPVEELIEPITACMEQGRFDFDHWGKQGLSKLFPLWMLKYLPNMASCHIGIAHDARGPNNSHTLGQVSSLLAILESAAVLARGDADVMFSGGVGSRLHPVPTLFRGDMNLSHRIEVPSEACRPFDADRDGMVNAEGAAMFVLETRAHAEERGARILARIAGGCSRFEPWLDNPHRTGDAIRNSIRTALQQSGVAPDEVGHVNANGLSTIEEDVIEGRAIHDELGDVPVTAPKSFVGNASAGAGALELVASLMALQEGVIPPTLNYRQPDPRCPVNVNTDPRAAAANPTALVLSQLTTGQAAALMLIKD